MNAKIDHENFVGGIREAVREALAEKEEADRFSKIEDLLQNSETTIKELTDALAARDEELATNTEEQESLQVKAAQLEAKVAELEEKLAEINKSSEELETRATAAEAELASIETARNLAVRMNELAESKVAAHTEEALVAQSARVENMSDEEFAAYKQERIDLRTQLEVELAAAAEQASKQASKEVTDGEGDDDVADLENVSKEQAAAAAAATLDIEVPSKDTVSRYLELANAMAKNLAGNGRE